MAGLKVVLTWLCTAMSMSVLFIEYCSGENCQPRCSWLSWEPWQDCSATCGGGYHIRSRGLCCQSDHNIDTCMNSCGKTREGFHQFEHCNQKCYNGAVFSGGMCQCGSGYYGSCCENQYTCGNPGDIDYGLFTGSSFVYGDRVQYNCNSGYNLTSGNTVRLCSAHPRTGGFWTGTQPTCTFVETCKSNPCQNGGECIDGLDMYTCRCGHGWTGTHCELDILPPMVDNCSGNQSYFISTEREEVTWPRPTFSDERGSDLVETANYPNVTFNFPWGQHAVQYTATKQTNGLLNECVFYINVYPTPCDNALVVPPYIPNGAVVCNGWLSQFADVCKVYCHEDWTLPLGSSLDTLYVCGASGQWAPSLDFDSCSDSLRKPKSGRKKQHYFSGLCTSPEVQTYLADQYIDHLSSSDVNPLCTSNPDQCSTQNVLIYCG